MATINEYPAVTNLSDDYQFLIWNGNETKAAKFGDIQAMLSMLELDQGQKNANKVLIVGADGYIKPL